MFIVNYRDGKPLVEGSPNGDKALTWDDVPDKIVNLQLAYPLRVRFRNSQNELMKETAPLLSLGRYDRYFFYNEAVAGVTSTGSKPGEASPPQLVAKVIAGIDDERRLVIEARLDAWGNCEIRRYNLDSLERRIQQGQFNSASIKLGA